MLYRSFPKIPELKISALGFGCMRLPILSGDTARIDEEKATRLLHRAIEAGVNYVDTAWPYHGGQSEAFVGRALAGPWRARVQVATKHPVWLAKTRDDWDRYLDEQLKRLSTDRIDFYLLHALDDDRFQAVRDLGGLEAMERARADGRIAHLGFSFHGPSSAFTRILGAYDWEFCQIQYNFVDVDYQAGEAGLALAAEKKVGVVVMEPLRGGALASKIPEPAQEIWSRAPAHRPAGWALRFVLDHAGVVTALSGMNEPEQVEENLQTASEAGVGCLSEADRSLIAAVRAVYQAKTLVPCTTCGYCMPCPNGVSISDIFSLYNASAMFDRKAWSANWYKNMLLSAGEGADQCTECGECAPKCPQKIAIGEVLKRAHAHLTST